jgi:hypothetical protein
MISRIASNPVLRRSAMVLMVVVIAVAIATNLGSHWRKLLDAVFAMDARWMALAFGICLVHRVVNTLGWTMVLWAMGRPLPSRTGARIWLASEACRWLPGSIWAYGSRGLLATRAGIPPAVAAVSLVWELLITMLAWFLVAALGLLFWTGPVPPAIEAAGRWMAGCSWPVAIVGAAAVGVAVVLGSKALGRKLSKLSAAGRDLRHFRANGPGLARVLLFHIGMVAVNGLTFWLVVQAAPGGDRCPVAVALAANSIAWLVGLFALFAPGGLVVREATIVVLLSGWMPAEQALTVALAWRAIQVAAELVGCLAIVSGNSSRAGLGRPETGLFQSL